MPSHLTNLIIYYFANIFLKRNIFIIEENIVEYFGISIKHL